jgi:GAF domain-containing protein
MPYGTNRLIDALPGPARQALTSRLTHTELEQHKTLFKIGDVVTQVHFPIDAVVSLVMPLTTGEAVETAMTGRDGAIGAGAALNGWVSLDRAVVQIGGQALSCDREDFKAVAKENPYILSLIGAHEQALFAQAQQSAACNAAHRLESRLARWLLRAADLRGGDELDLTQEYIAEMLGVRRTSVTVVARTLQYAGMIKYSRGHIKFTDVRALQATACECYAAVKRNYDAMLGPRLLDGRSIRQGQFGAFPPNSLIDPSDGSRAVLLDVLVRAAKEHAKGEARAAFYIADAQATKLYHVTGMPEAYAQRVNGFPISPRSLACGLAAAIRLPVITPDVTEDARWKPWLSLARDFDYRACWSFPLEGPERKVLGTLAMYYGKPREATSVDLDVAATLSRTAADIISRR